MENHDRKKYSQQTLQDQFENRKIRIGFYVIVGLGGLYALGHVFKISAHTVKGYNELKSAIKNGKQ